MWKSLTLGVSLLLPAMTFGAPTLRADGEEAKKEEAKPKEEVKETRPVIDETRVYFGKPKCCKAPAVVDAARVYKSIAEYRKILDNKLTEKDAEYTLLMVKASKKFRAAVEGAAADNAADLVANLGAVTWDGHTVPDLTDATLKKVEAQKNNP